MRFTPMHRELGLPASAPLDWELMEAIVKNRLPEQRDLDFKMQAYNAENPQAQEELAKDLCAMANSGGGWIVCGIKTDQHNDAASQLCPFKIDKNTAPLLSQIARTMVQPPLMEMKVHEIAAPDSTDKKYILALEIPPSDYFPHLCFYNKSKEPLPFRAPVRSGPATTWLTEPELRKLYLESFNRREQRKAHVKMLFDEYMEYGEIYEGLTLVFLATPTTPQQVEIPSCDLTNHLKNIPIRQMLINQATPNLLPFDKLPERSYRSWVIRHEADSSQQRYYRCEVGEDGNLRIAIRLGGWKLDTSSDSYPVEYPTHAPQRMVEIALAQSFSILVGLQKKWFNSGFQILVGLAPVGTEAVMIRKPGHFRDKIAPIEDCTPIRHHRIAKAYLNLTEEEDGQSIILKQLVLDILNQGGIELTREIR